MEKIMMNLFKKRVTPNCSTCAWLLNGGGFNLLCLTPKCTALGYSDVADVYGSKRCRKVYRLRDNKKLTDEK